MARPMVIETRELLKDHDMTQNTYKETNPLDLSTIAQQGIFSLQVEIEAASTSSDVTITYYTSNDGVAWVVGDSDIVTSVDVSSGLDKMYDIEPRLCKWIKIRVTENDSGTVADMTLTLAVQ